jgi:nucleotide-binding universal stress UspA family protein
VEQEQKYAQTQFEKLIREYSSRLGNDSTLRYIVKKGKVYREVVNQANSYKNAVVSASTHGASGFEELFVGSNALKIIAATSQPVFTIRHTPVPSQIKRIILPIKLHVDTRQKAPIAADLAELFGAEIHVLSVTSQKNKRDLDRLDSYARQVLSYLKARQIKTVSKVLTGDHLANITCNYTEAVDADMIVSMSTAIDKWSVFLGSYAHQVVNRANVPVLNITPKEKRIPTGFTTHAG